MLVALHKTTRSKGEKRFVVDTDGSFWQLGERGIFPYWQLGKPLHLQSEETQQAILDLLK